jgi:hypothetical protein
MAALRSWRELLENTHRIGGTETVTALVSRMFLVRVAAADHHRCGVEELGAMMFANPKNIKAHLICVLDLFQKILHARVWAKRETRRWIRDGCGNRNNERLLREQPSQGNLNRCCTLLFRQLSEKINSRHICCDVFRRKAWERRSNVHFGVELRSSIYFHS